MQTNVEAILQMTSEPVEIRDLVRVFFKRLWVLPVTTAVCLAAGVLTILYWTPTYEAQVRMEVVGSPKVTAPYYNDNPAHEEFMAATYAEIIKNQDVLRQVVVALHLEDRDTKQYDSALKVYTLKLRDWGTDRWKQLKAGYAVRTGRELPAVEPNKDKFMKAVEDLDESITAEGVDKSDVIDITVADPDPVMDARIGNTLAYAYSLFNLRQELTEMSVRYGPDYPTIRQIRDAIALMSARLIEFDPDRKIDFGAGNVKIVQHAFPPTEHKKPKRKYLLLGSLLGGLLGGGFLIFLLEKIDPSCGSSEAVRRELDVPFIGAVPEKVWKRQRRLKELDTEFYLEALLPIAYRIQTMRTLQGLRTISFSTTHLSANDSKLAQALAFCLSRLDAEAQSGKACKVLFVESDVKKKEQLLSRALVATGNRKSMTDYVEGQAEMDQAVISVDPLLSITTLNGSTPSALHVLRESKYRSFLKTAQSAYDLILFQGPSYSRRVDFTFLNALCDATVLIIDEGRTRKKTVASMLKDLEMSKTKVLGVIVNNQKHYIPKFIYNWV